MAAHGGASGTGFAVGVTPGAADPGVVLPLGISQLPSPFRTNRGELPVAPLAAHAGFQGVALLADTALTAAAWRRLRRTWGSQGSPPGQTLPSPLPRRRGAQAAQPFGIMGCGPLTSTAQATRQVGRPPIRRRIGPGLVLRGQALA